MDLSIINDKYEVGIEDGIFKGGYVKGDYYFWVLTTNDIQIKKISEKMFNQYDEDTINLDDYDFANVYEYDNDITTLVKIKDFAFEDNGNVTYVEHFTIDTHIFLLFKDVSGDYFIAYYDTVNKKKGVLTVSNSTDIDILYKIKIVYDNDDYNTTLVYKDSLGDLIYSPNNIQNLQYNNNNPYIEDNNLVLEVGTSFSTEKCSINDKNIVMFQNDNIVTTFFHKYFIYEDEESTKFDNVDVIKKVLDFSTIDNDYLLSPFKNPFKLKDDVLIRFQCLYNEVDNVEDGSSENSIVFGYIKYPLNDIFNDDLLNSNNITSYKLNTYQTLNNTNYNTDFKLLFPKDKQLNKDDNLVLLLNNEEIMFFDYEDLEFDYKYIDLSGTNLSFSNDFIDDNEIEVNIINNYLRLDNNFTKFEYILEKNYNSDVVFINILRFLPEWFKNSQSLVAVVDIIEKVYNDGIRIPDKDYDFLDVGVNYKNLYDKDDRLYFLFKESPNIFFYNKNNSMFDGTTFEKFEKLKDNNSIALVDDEYLYPFLKDLGMDWIYDDVFFGDLKRVNMLDNNKLISTMVNNKKTDKYEFATSQSSDVEIFRNNLDLYTDLTSEEVRNILKMILNNRMMIHSKSFYKMIVYILGFMYEVKFLHHGVNNNSLVNINTGEMNKTFSDNFDNKVYINVDFEDLQLNSNSLMNSIDYLIKVIKKTLPINLRFEGVVFTFNKEIYNLKHDIKETLVEVIKNY